MPPTGSVCSRSLIVLMPWTLGTVTENPELPHISPNKGMLSSRDYKPAWIQRPNARGHTKQSIDSNWLAAKTNNRTHTHPHTHRRKLMSSTWPTRARVVSGVKLFIFPSFTMLMKARLTLTLWTCSLSHFRLFLLCCSVSFCRSLFTSPRDGFHLTRLSLGCQLSVGCDVCAGNGYSLFDYNHRRLSIKIIYSTCSWHDGHGQKQLIKHLFALKSSLKQELL